MTRIYLKNQICFLRVLKKLFVKLIYCFKYAIFNLLCVKLFAAVGFTLVKGELLSFE